MYFTIEQDSVGSISQNKSLKYQDLPQKILRM